MRNSAIPLCMLAILGTQIEALAQATDARFANKNPVLRRRAAKSGMNWDLLNNDDKPSKGLGSDLFNETPGSRTGAPLKLPNGASITPGPNGSKTLLTPDGTQHTLRPDGSFTRLGADGSITERAPDGTRATRFMDGKESILNPDGTGKLKDGTVINRNPLDNSVNVSRPDGLGFESKPDGTKVFKRSNGLETVRTPEGRVYMRDSKTGQPTGRELIK